MAKTERPDLAAMIVPLARALMALERPVLAEHGVSMWGYAVLSALGRGTARGQGVLAEEIGADKTRIIPVLDDLQERGLIERRPDPADRRARLLALTPAGRALRDAVQADIQAREEKLLDRLSAADRRGFLNALSILAALPREEVVGESATPR
ncbi:MarR family winged helix-turn-helix transcriptional regulator [Nocardia sp. CDC159]|uniref:MarR family winged helix-turn-helix transcriptional regulator n=1 Tax=Nocardia pulmonis TaxID=2951408 RepID=A0A9X2EG39_9NOCA|nr:MULTISPECIES: MarR family winged helix-turn-helix transcriptional regulator [Nocardia]MCM6777646.1 MarR family winged helix-turn-helix transcriptional regulator [Nocardia pulmonis]MCM6790550.1 MarR family winged helix-turn-helix transcriptional regulator [Nocardia sp. CDC159]